MYVQKVPQTRRGFFYHMKNEMATYMEYEIYRLQQIHTVKENECHTARFPVRRFDCFDHLYKGILIQMIPHLKALIFSY